MSSEDELVLNLELLESAVPHLPEDLAHKIRHLRDWHSILTDLRFANDQAGTLMTIFDEAAAAEAGSDLQNSAIALFNSAVMLYARATKTGSDHRATFVFTNQFDEVEKRNHALICDLRNEGVAHFGPGVALNGSIWNQDGVFAVWDMKTGATQLLMASRRKMAERATVRMLAVQSHRAVMIAHKEAQAREPEVLRRMIECCVNGTIAPEQLAQCSVDLGDFFRDEKASAVLLDGERIGARKGTATETLAP